MSINEMTIEEFRALPAREWGQDIDEFDSLIILPSDIRLIDVIKYNVIQWLHEKFNWFDSYYLPNGLHDSGYRCMDFVAVKNNEPICRLSGCSDVIHFNGIRGYGKDWFKKYGRVPDLVEPPDWNIDCLRQSGLLRIFGGKLSCGASLSSFELYTRKEQPND